MAKEKTNWQEIVDDLRGIAGVLERMMLGEDGVSPNEASPKTENFFADIRDVGSTGSAAPSETPRGAPKTKEGARKEVMAIVEEARRQELLRRKADEIIRDFGLIVDPRGSDKTNEKEKEDSPNAASTISGSVLPKVSESGSNEDLAKGVEWLKAGVRNLRAVSDCQHQINDNLIKWQEVTNKNLAVQTALIDRLLSQLNQQEERTNDLSAMLKTRFDR